MAFEVVMDQAEDVGAIIRVIGVGSGGVNAVNTMIASKVVGVEYVAINTDFQHLKGSRAEMSLGLGATRGRGAGGDPQKGREAAIQERGRIEEVLKGADMVVLATGLGGGTGTGATPVVAEIARAMGILTVAVCTMPFEFEGRAKMKRAGEGLETLKKVVDAYVVIPNQKLRKFADKGLSSLKAFAMVDQVLCDAMTGVVELITRPGYINRDFEDVRAVLQSAGLCVMGTGLGEGSERASEAVMAAISNPLLEDTPIEGARHVLVNIVQGTDGTMDEQDVIMAKINACIASDAELSYGLAIDERLGEKVKVTIIASGMGDIEVMETRGFQEVPDVVTRGVSYDAPVYQPPRPQIPEPISLDAQRPGQRPTGGMRVPPHIVNAPSPFLPANEEESELDPTPAYLRRPGEPVTQYGTYAPPPGGVGKY